MKFKFRTALRLAKNSVRPFSTLHAAVLGSFALILMFGLMSGSSGVGAQTTGMEMGPEGFRTPSNNIHCQVFAGDSGTAAELRCDMVEITNAVPNRPSSCELDWDKAFGISQDDQIGGRLCVGDTVRDDRLLVLEYGAIWQGHGFTCLSEQTGLTCFNARRHGFTLSKAAQKFF